MLIQEKKLSLRLEIKSLLQLLELTMLNHHSMLLMPPGNKPLLILKLLETFMLAPKVLLMLLSKIYN
jgi:hypothetical protein